MKFKNNSKFKCAADRKPGVFGQALIRQRENPKACRKDAEMTAVEALTSSLAGVLFSTALTAGA
jgi:hypothetical protein